VNVTVANGTSTPTNPASADTTPPVAQVSYSLNKRKILSIKASATDNVAVTSLTISIDGAVKAIGNSSSLSYNWSTTGVATGSHVITVVAKDAAGNAGSASATFVK
jgi:hypothetical protein